jgi:hypothetical protein
MSKNVEKCKSQGGMHAKGGRMLKLMGRSFPFYYKWHAKKKRYNLLNFFKKCKY